MCSGTGHMKRLEKTRLVKPQLIKIARQLIEERYSYRDIARMLHYKSPRSIAILLGKK